MSHTELVLFIINWFGNSLTSSGLLSWYECLGTGGGEGWRVGVRKTGCHPRPL